MNIFYIHCHDAGRYISPYGENVRTPHLQAFAEEAIRFDDAHCCAPTCSPSRAALLTGEYAHEAGMLGLTHRGFQMKKPERHLASVLESQGYETVLAGIHHEWNFTEKTAYQTYIAPSSNYEPETPEADVQVGEYVASFLRKRKENRALYLACGFFLPHRIFPDVEEKRLPQNPNPPQVLPDVSDVQKDWDEYLTAASYMDEAFGKVWQAIKDTGMADNSIIFFTTDHGVAFPGMKCNLNTAGTGVSLLMRTPDLLKPGTACDALVSHIDVAPTLFDYAGLEAPCWYRGRSMRPLLEGASPAIRENAFAEVTFHAAYEPKRSVRTKTHLYIRNYDLARPIPLCNVDPGKTKSWFVENNAFTRKKLFEELYDLQQDPLEQNNVANVSDYETTKQEMSRKLDVWMEETDDPLLHGDVPPPAGATITPNEQINP